jgi:L-ribulokinase
MAAAVVGGLYPTITDAQQAMGNGFETEYKPIASNALKYKNLYNQYSRMGELVEKETMKKSAQSFLKISINH